MTLSLDQYSMSVIAERTVHNKYGEETNLAHELEVLVSEAVDYGTPVSIVEATLSWVVDANPDMVTDYRGDLYADIPHTYSRINGVNVDEANRRTIKSEGWQYVEESPMTWGPLAFNLSDMIREATHEDIDAIRDRFESCLGLMDYPILDDSEWCEVEDEAVARNWRDYGADDLMELYADDLVLTAHSEALYRLMQGEDGHYLSPEDDGYGCTSFPWSGTVTDARVAVADLLAYDPEGWGVEDDD